MAGDATEIVERWRNHAPSEVPIEDVEKVVAAYFPGAHRFNDKGSHFLIIAHEALRLADTHGFDANFPGGRLTISHSKGKHVKGWLIRNLLRAIELKQAFERADEQGRTS